MCMFLSFLQKHKRCLRNSRRIQSPTEEYFPQESKKTFPLPRLLLPSTFMHSSIKFLFLFSNVVLFLNPTNMHSLPFSFDTRSFELHTLPHKNLTFLGDSHLQDRVIVLTKEGMVTNGRRSAGVALYNHPILFRNHHSDKVPSFYTMFAFSMEKIQGDERASGDGLTFLISPDGDPLESHGYLGLVDSIGRSRNKFIAIEFDTKFDPAFHDPDDNHVGLDINNVFSVKLAKSSSLGVDLKSGYVIFTWIDYKNNEKRLEVFLSDSFLKPKKALLKVDIDLSNYLKDRMFVGFSAATEGSIQLTRIHRWEFTTVEFSPAPPPPSPPESGRSFPNPSESGHRHSQYSSKFAIGLTVGVCSVPFVVLFGRFFWKKLMGMIQKLGGTKYVEEQTIDSSVGFSCREIQLSVLVDDVARGLNIEKILLDNKMELIHVKTVKSTIPLCNAPTVVKPNTIPPCNSLPPRMHHIASI